MKLHKRLASALVATMVLTSMPVATMANDYESHWASEAISKWTNKKVVEGFEDGTFRPSETITKAQFAKILVELMGYNTTEGSSTYTDVAEGKWYSDYVTKISAADVMHETGSTFMPNSGITREEAAYALVNAYKLDNNGVEKAAFTDETAIADWALENVKTLYNAGYIKGNPDGSFNPKGTLTRAELITMIDRMNSDVVNTKGEYSNDVTGNLVVNTTGVTLKDMTIDGDLYLAEGIGKGDVDLENVTVNGRVIVEGGGVNSIKADRKCKFNGAFLVYAKSPVRIIIKGDKVDVYVMAGTEVVLTGKFDEIKVGAGAKVILDDATVDTITADETGKAPVIEIKSNSRVEKIVADVRVTIQGNGKLVELVANAKDISSAIKPDRTSGSEKPSISTTTSKEWSSGMNDEDESSKPGPTEQREEYTVTVENKVDYKGEITLNNGTNKGIQVIDGTKLSLTEAEAKAITSATVDTGFKATVTLEGKTIKVTVTKEQTGAEKETVTYPVRFVKADNENEAVTTSGTITVVVEGQDAPITVKVDNASESSFDVEHQAGTQIKITSISFTNKEGTLTVQGVVDGTQGYKFVIPGEASEPTPSEVVNYTINATGFEGTLMFDGKPVEKNTISAKPADVTVDKFTVKGYKVVEGSFNVTTDEETMTGTVTIVFEKDETPVTDFTYTLVNTGDAVSTSATIKVQINDVEYDVTDNEVTLSEEIATDAVVKVLVNGEAIDADVNATDKTISYKYVAPVSEFTYTLSNTGEEVPETAIVELKIGDNEPIPGTKNDNGTYAFNVDPEVAATLKEGDKVTVLVDKVEFTGTVGKENTITFAYTTEKLTITSVTYNIGEGPQSITNLLDKQAYEGLLKINNVVVKSERLPNSNETQLVVETGLPANAETVTAELEWTLDKGGKVIFVADATIGADKTITSIDFTSIKADMRGSVNYVIGQGDDQIESDLVDAISSKLTIAGEEIKVEEGTTNFTISTETGLVDLTDLPSSQAATLEVTFADDNIDSRFASFKTSDAKCVFDPRTGDVNYVIGGESKLTFNPSAENSTTTLEKANVFGTIEVKESLDGTNLITAANRENVKITFMPVDPMTTGTKSIEAIITSIDNTTGFANYITKEPITLENVKAYKVVVENVVGTEIPMFVTDLTSADLAELVDKAELSTWGGNLSLSMTEAKPMDVVLKDSEQNDYDTKITQQLDTENVLDDNEEIDNDKFVYDEEGTFISVADNSRSTTSRPAVSVTTTTGANIKVETVKRTGKIPMPSFPGVKILKDTTYELKATAQTKLKPGVETSDYTPKTLELIVNVTIRVDGSVTFGGITITVKPQQ